MSRRIRRSVALAAALALLPAASAAAQGPPPPKAASGQPVQAVGTGVGTPTSFASDGTNLFLGSAPGEGKPSTPGGLWVLRDGQFAKLDGAPPLVFGLTYDDGTLYVSALKQIIAMKGFDGTAFASSKVIYKAPKKFPGFNGLTIGPDGRLLAGVSLNGKFDGKDNPVPNTDAVVSMTTKGKDLKVVADGLRQPWQFTHVKGMKWPLVSSLAVDTDPAPDDIIVEAKPGTDYGYPTCETGDKQSCKGYTKPRITLPPHSSPMGLASVGTTLYAALFGGIGKSGPEIVSMTTKGKKITPVLSGFVAPVVALAIVDGTIYAGDVTGTVYSTPLR